MKNIVAIRVYGTYESCERTTYWVELKTDEGFTMTPDSFATGSVYTDHVGLSKDEARDRALTMAHDWADFLDIAVDPYVEEGQTYEPSMKLETYTMRREERAELKAKAEAVEVGKRVVITDDWHHKTKTGVIIEERTDWHPSRLRWLVEFDGRTPEMEDFEGKSWFRQGEVILEEFADQMNLVD